MIGQCPQWKKGKWIFTSPIQSTADMNTKSNMLPERWNILVTNWLEANDTKRVNNRFGRFKFTLKRMSIAPISWRQVKIYNYDFNWDRRLLSSSEFQGERYTIITKTPNLIETTFWQSTIINSISLLIYTYIYTNTSCIAWSVCFFKIKLI